MDSPDIVVVSGAGTGIGRAISHRLVSDGFHVIAVGRRPGPLELLAKELAPHLDAVSADLATAEGAATVAERVRIADGISSAGRRCAGVVAAAGGLSPRGASNQAQGGDPGLNGDRALNGDRTLHGDRVLDDVPGLERVPELDRVRRDWLASFESNVLTAVLLVDALREAIERGGGRVVLLSSVAALRGSGGGPYGAAKAALHAFVYDLARELGSRGGYSQRGGPRFCPGHRVLGGQAHQRVPA